MNMKKALYMAWWSGLLLAAPLKAVGQDVSYPEAIDSFDNTVLDETDIKRERYARCGRAVLMKARPGGLTRDSVLRVKTREEIWGEYQTAPGYRSGRKQLPYEFYELLDMLEAPEEKAVIAQAAMGFVRDEDGDRPWPLAAYELAKAKLQLGVADTNLLKPYIDVQLVLDCRKQKMDNFGNMWWAGWYNDEDFVWLHAAILCRAGLCSQACKLVWILYFGWHGCCRPYRVTATEQDTERRERLWKLLARTVGEE